MINSIANQAASGFSFQKNTGMAGKAEKSGYVSVNDFQAFVSTTRLFSADNSMGQAALSNFTALDPAIKNELQYNGRPIADLNPSEASSLVAEDGYFGVAQTSERIAEFVINGAGDDLEKLQQGREGMLKGFEQAEKQWGGALPDISQQTMATALEAVDERIRELGGNVVDITA